MTITQLQEFGIHLPCSQNSPVKSNGVQLDKKYGLFMDYMVLNFEGQPRLSSHLLEINEQDYGSTHFKRRIKIAYKGVDFGVMIFEPRSNIINKNLCQLKLANHLFYLMPLESIKKLLDEFMKITRLDFKAFNRIDVALDFEGDLHNIEPLLAFINMGVLKVSGRKKALNCYNETKNGVVTREGVQVGKRSSYRFLRIYNKVIEMQTNYKTYIKTQWDKIGLVGDVWRYEYQLNSKYLREIEGLTLENVFSHQGLFNLLEMANKNFFELRYNTGKSETNKERPFYMFDWAEIRSKCKVVTQLLKRVKRVVRETLIGQQRLVKSCLRSYFSTQQSIEYILPIKRTLSDYDLWYWWGTKLPFYLDEFRKSQFVKSMDMKQFREDMQLEI